MTNEAKPEYTGEVEDWVVQDIVPRRVAIDQYRWITKQGYASSWGMTLLSPKDRQEISHGYIDDHGARLEVRCKRKDFPIDGYKVSVDKDGKEKYEPLGRKCDVAERPDDWVTQDVVPRRPDVDEFRWISKDGTAKSWSLTPEGYNDLIFGTIVLDSRLEVRCKRKDHPVLGKAEKKPLPCGYCTAATFKGWQNGKCPYCGLCRTVAVIPEIGFNEDDELNAATKTRAWTFGKPAQTGHFLISFLDPAVTQKDITACTIDKDDDDKPLWFVYLGQTSDFVDPVVPKAKYTLLTHTSEPFSKWCKDPADVQEKLNLGWVIAKEQEMQVPEWDR